MSEKHSGWIGVDLDATLAEYYGYQGPIHIGPPVPKMLQRVKEWLAAGITVKIMTAEFHARSTGKKWHNRDTLSRSGA